MSATKTEQELYNELSLYTLAHSDGDFIHQHAVDAYTAQHADEHTKPIGVAFALIGLYLAIEKGFSGRQVQEAHMRLAHRKRNWPTFHLPEDRGAMTVSDVMHALPGDERDQAIRKWCASVWAAHRANHAQVTRLVRDLLCH